MEKGGGGVSSFDFWFCSSSVSFIIRNAF